MIQYRLQADEMGIFCEQNVKVASLWSATIKTKYGLQVKVILLCRGRRFYLEQYEVLIAASHATFIVEYFRASCKCSPSQLRCVKLEGLGRAC